MLYINDTDKSYYNYDDVVELAVQSGINYKKAYLYLASLGVRGVKARVMSKTTIDYLPVKKIAVQGDKVVTKVTSCSSCKGLIIECQ